jgi:uncharacterized membrane protein YdbT with pleckstrin-like domain
VDEKPLCDIQPVVVPARYFVWAPLLSGLAALFPAFVVGLVMLFASEVPNAEDPLLPGVYQWGLTLNFAAAVAAVAFLVSMVLLGISDFHGPGRTCYRIFPDRLDYCEGLWVRSHGTLRFDQVSDVQLTEGFLQQTRGAGTITFFTGEGDGKKFLRQLTNIPRPQEVYDLLRSLVLQKARTEQAPRPVAPTGNGRPPADPSAV